MIAYMSVYGMGHKTEDRPTEETKPGEHPRERRGWPTELWHAQDYLSWGLISEEFMNAAAILREQKDRAHQKV